MNFYRLYQTVRVRPHELDRANASTNSSPDAPQAGDVGNIVDAPAAGVVTVECVDPTGRLRWVTDLSLSRLEPVGPLPFRLLQKLPVFGRQLLLTDKLFDHTFTAAPGDRIADCAIAECDIPRSLDEHGRQRLDRFGFILAPGQESSVDAGEVVYLVQSVPTASDHFDQ
jgi:hypothetical protein